MLQTIPIVKNGNAGNLSDEEARRSDCDCRIGRDGIAACLLYIGGAA